MTSALIELLFTQQTAALNESFRLWRSAWNLPRVFRRACEPGCLATPCRVVHREGSLRLLQFRSSKPAVWAEPLLLCAAPVSRPTILDLGPKRSVVRQMIAAGFDTYLLDWGEATPADFGGGLSGLIAESFRAVAEVIRVRSGMPHFHLLGYCLGGTLAAIFTALEPALVKDLVLMATPIDYGVESSLLKAWTEEDCLDVDALIDAYGNCPGALLRNCFAMLKPVRNFYGKFGELADRLGDNEFVDSFMALERWARTGVSVSGSVFRDIVKSLYQRNDLVSGQLEIDGRRVRLDRISCPVLLLTAAEDHLVSPRSTLGLISRICSRDVKLMSLQGGHESLAVSSTAHTTFWPEVAQWLADHSVPRTGPWICPGDEAVGRPPFYGHGSIHDRLARFPQN